jgi:hypothetical protein
MYMKYLFAFVLLCFGSQTHALNSTMKLTAAELNENETIANSGTDIATAMRVLQLQLGATGCYRPSVSFPERFEKRDEYNFNIESENCVVISKSSKCESSDYSARNLKANPNASTYKVVGADKYLVCLKSSSGTTRTPTKDARK